jgi:ATP-binding cassette subfamily B protein
MNVDLKKILNISKLVDNTIYIFSSLPKKIKIKLVYFLGIFLISTVVEILSIVSIYPFIFSLTKNEDIYRLPYIKYIDFEILINDQDYMIIALGLTFISLILTSGYLKVCQNKQSIKIAFEVGNYLSDSIYKKFIFEKYEKISSLSSSDFVSLIVEKSNMITNGIIMPCLTIVSAISVFLIICSYIVFLEPLISLIILISFIFIYYIIISLFRKTLHKNAKEMDYCGQKIIGLIQETFGGFRDIVLGDYQSSYLQEFQSLDRRLKKAQASSAIIGNCPKYLLESMGISILTVAAYLISQKSAYGVSSTLPILAVLVLSVNRLLPLVNQIYGAWTSVLSNAESLNTVIKILKCPTNNIELINQYSDEVVFNNFIELNNITYHYPSSDQLVLKAINLRIQKGARIGLIGSSGSGKSTLLDIILGLISPTSGFVVVDESKLTQFNTQSWQKRIRHVPQHVFLMNSTIKENIAFGVSVHLIDDAKLRKSAECAQILEAIDSMPLGFETVVGERGAKLSGGQRQRIGIARALYENAEVLVFDEAASALDFGTESRLLDVIKALPLDKTIIYAAHRLPSLEFCDVVYEIKNGSIGRVNIK